MTSHAGPAQATGEMTPQAMRPPGGAGGLTAVVIGQSVEYHRPAQHLPGLKPAGIHEGERPAAAGEQDGEISRVVRVLAAFRIVVGTGAVKGHVAPGAAVAERVNVAGIKAVPGQPQGAYQQ